MDMVGRTRWWRISVAAAAIAQLCVFVVGPVLGAPATPSSEMTPTCDVPARTPDEITALLASTDISTPSATTDGQTLPAGVPADADTAVAIERVVHLWLA